MHTCNNPTHLTPSPLRTNQRKATARSISFSIALPLLHQQKVHTSIRQHKKHRPKDPQAHRIHPQRRVIEPKRAQDRSARHLNVEPVLVVDETERADFVDDKSLEGVVEDGELLQSLVLLEMTWTGWGGKRHIPFAARTARWGCCCG